MKMITHRRAVAFLCLAVIGVSWPLWARSANPDSGQTIYRVSCAHCHGIAGDGNSEMAGYLTPPPANLQSALTQSKSDDELKKVILYGRPGTAMAGFEGTLEDFQLSDLVAYLRTLRAK